ncbi:hypothetical protein [Aeromonas dhakensis]|uniref:hypothetical protein n=1 Tax=Aeromonas dhakensis TaxID=196024 RepID=UPI0038D0453A
MKIWKVCLLAAQLMLAAGALSGGSSPSPPMDNGMFDRVLTLTEVGIDGGTGSGHY